MSEAKMHAKRRLWAEFLTLFVVLPICVAMFLPARLMLPVLLAMTVVGAVLLHVTPQFRWRGLMTGWGAVDWRVILPFSLLTALASAALVVWIVPGAGLRLLRGNPAIWLAVMALYPILSALPQEILFRPLFFHRYGAIIPQGRAGLILNAAIFSLAHLLYWSPIVAGLTFAGGLAFAWAYEVKRSFPLAVVLHALAGNILFTSGAGILFVSGMATRPF